MALSADLGTSRVAGTIGGGGVQPARNRTGYRLGSSGKFEEAALRDLFGQVMVTHDPHSAAIDHLRMPLHQLLDDVLPPRGRIGSDQFEIGLSAGASDH